jgi:hypothetical protein
MKRIKAITVANALLFMIISASAQTEQAAPSNDSTLHLPAKYIRQVENKVDKYYTRIICKTEKTLERLTKYENQIHKLLLKVNPEAAVRLFGSNQTTFATLLEQYRHCTVPLKNFGREYDEYRDKLQSTMAYIADAKGSVDEKYVKPAKEAKKKMQHLNQQADNTEAIQQFIKERRRQLMEQAIQFIGKSKYLKKINAEAFYYATSLRNFREIFRDERKAEVTAIAILNKIPAFRKFLQKNNALASLFSVPGGGAGQSLAGLQTISSVQNLIQQQFGSGPSAMATLRNNVQNAQSQLNQLKDKILQGGGSSSSDELPDFKPKNMAKTKTFAQRLEYSTNLQHQRGNSFLPVTSDIGISIGYKLNDRSVAGIGISGRVGWGRNIQNIRITGEGIGLRTYMNWKLKDNGSFWLSGGAELNYQSRFYSTTVLNNFNNWQQSALIGVMKKYSVGKKLKGTVSVLYDALYNLQAPARQPVVFRVGYSLK